MIRLAACLGLALLAIPLLASVPQRVAAKGAGISAPHAVVLARAETRSNDA